MIRRLPWFPGYTVAGAATLAFIATAPGQTFILSLLNTPLRDAFGIGALTLNTAYALATVLASFPLVVVGSWTDRIGPRRALAWTAFAFGCACMVMSTVTGFWGVALSFFLLRFLGQGALSMVSQHAVAMWFHRRLGSIHGIKQVAVFTVWVAFPPAALALIASVGWRWSYVIFGLAVWVTIVPTALLAVRDRPEDLGLEMDADPVRSGSGVEAVEGVSAAGVVATTRPAAGAGGGPRVADPARAPSAEPAFTLREALSTRAYWILAGVVFLSPLVGTAFLFDMQPLLARRGMGVQDAAFTVSAWTAGMAAMAIPAGWLADRVRPSRLIPAGIGMIALSSLGIWWAPGVRAAAAVMLLFSLGQTLVATVSTATIARYFGRAHHGAIRASLVRIGVIGTGLGPVFTGLSADRTGGYLAACVAFVLMCVPAALASLTLHPPLPEG